MKNYPHPSLIKKFNKTDLREISRKNNLKFRNSTIEKLLLAADNKFIRVAFAMLRDHKIN